VSNVSARMRASTSESRVAADSRRYNEDLAPVPPEKRTWRTINYLTLWVGMSSQIPTYLVAGGLIALGMNWWQAIFTVALGNALILIPILLNSHVGAKYGIPFPVFVRASYWIIRRRQLSVRDLFSENRVYRYTGGWNVRAIAYLGLARLGLAVPRARGAAARGGAWRMADGASPRVGSNR